MKNTFLPPTLVNYLKYIFWQRINCDFASFDRKIKTNRDLFGMLRNFTDPLYVFIEVSAKKLAQNSISMFWFLEFLTQLKFIFNPSFGGKF